MSIKRIPVKFTSAEYAEIHKALRERGNDSFQAVCRGMMLEWAGGKRPGPLLHVLPAGPPEKRFLELAQLLNVIPKWAKTLKSSFSTWVNRQIDIGMGSLTDTEQERVFNHALSHLIAHWAGFIATLGLLATSTLVLAGTESLTFRDFLGLLVVVLGTTVASVYFLIRMHDFGKVVNDLLPPKYITAVTPTWPPGKILKIARGLILILVLVDLILLLTRY